MAKSPIEWAPGSADGREGHTINPFRAKRSLLDTLGTVLGIAKGHFCVKISPGCQNCYSSRLQSRFRMLEFLAKNRSKVELFLDELKLQDVLRRKKPTGYFWADMSDMFLDDYPFEWVDKCAAVVALTPQHLHMWLTKRPERALEYFKEVIYRQEVIGIHAERMSGIDRFIMGSDEETGCGDDILSRWQMPFPNLFLGVSVESREYKWRIDVLRKIPVAVRFLSIEPLLEDIGELDLTGIHWVIIGGESGQKARPFNINWARSIVRQCKSAGVACFVKQIGAKPYACRESVNGKPDHSGCITEGLEDIKDRKGGDMSEWSGDLRVRQFPN